MCNTAFFSEILFKKKNIGMRFELRRHFAADAAHKQTICLLGKKLFFLNITISIQNTFHIEPYNLYF
jgi:hypothetical protein